MSNEISRFLQDHLGGVDLQYESISKGGSDRGYFRVRLPDGKTFIFMEYGAGVEENAYWVEINRFLNDMGLPVPRIIAYDSRRRLLLIEDAGDEDLYALREEPWHKRRHYYLRILSDIHRLHRHDLADLPATLKLSKGYDRPLYVWEQNYFRENFIEGVCRLTLSDEQMRNWTDECSALIDRLQKISPCLIHRDLQSQNILMKKDRPVFIDFQGMRPGNLFYDLGSLICDPYVVLRSDERNELIAFYYRIMAPAYSLDDFTDYFWEAAAQRLMQALGAYGFLGLKKNKPDFLNHCENGIQNLITATASAGSLPVLNDIAKTCFQTLNQR